MQSGYEISSWYTGCIGWEIIYKVQVINCAIVPQRGISVFLLEPGFCEALLFLPGAIGSSL